MYFLYTHCNGFLRFSYGLKANTEISYWSYRALKRHFPQVRFLHFHNEALTRIQEIRPQDVVIGHIGETFLKASCYTKRLIAFNPWSGDEDRSKEGFNCIPKEKEMDYYNRAATLVLLTSEFNKREYVEKPRNFWYPYFQELSKTKRLRFVHQPIDLTLFKRIKWEYTTDHFLYIGNRAPMKGTEEAIQLVHQVGRKLYLYGEGGKKLYHLNQAQVNRLRHEADFFIQPGLWEAQCVSILESAARGFIPIVTEETGYPYSHPFLLRKLNFKYNLQVLQDLLQTSPQERRLLADQLYQQLTEDPVHNNWDSLTDVLVEEVGKTFIQTIEI